MKPENTNALIMFAIGCVVTFLICNFYYNGQISDLKYQLDQHKQHHHNTMMDKF